MPQWLSHVLKRIKELAREEKVRLTYKAMREIASIDYGLDYDDICQILMDLTSRDSEGRIISNITKEWMYVFKPEIGNTTIYLKVILRDNCIVVSFHEDMEDVE
jgi:hypothetical protein